MLKYQQTLPRTGPEREALREKGQFWTPEWVAEAMVSYVLYERPDHIFDPAVGSGVFFRAAMTVAKEMALDRLHLIGTEIDPNAIRKALEKDLTEHDVSNVMIRDFVINPPHATYRAIVANPPYIRHHRLTNEIKVECKRMCNNSIGKAIDGRAGLHIFFLIRALQLLEKGGRLAFIMPADTCEGVFALDLWNWITQKYRLDAVITFSPAATPFPGVDTNAIIFLIKNTERKDFFYWVKCTEPNTSKFKEWVRSDFQSNHAAELIVHKRKLNEGLSTGLSRPPLDNERCEHILLDFASVMRGIATGANDFFFLTKKQVEKLQIPDDLLVPAVSRTRDVPGNEITNELLDILDAKGRPTLLFSPDNRLLDAFPLQVRDYLIRGYEIGLPNKPLISMRNPWYQMEKRIPPPILFAYLGRRNARFIRNYSGVVPLTGFLCVYPHYIEKEYINNLFKMLSDAEVVNNLSLVGKSYGGGALKVEPRSLEKLPIPNYIAERYNLAKPCKVQTELFKL
ncbi:MAG TPA: N-6 DNA methylase [bacterium]|nr:N-6 DNA methylase [bacterium]